MRTRGDAATFFVEVLESRGSPRFVVDRRDTSDGVWTPRIEHALSVGVHAIDARGLGESEIDFGVESPILGEALARIRPPIWRSESSGDRR
jgi:hypothetical protein